MSGQQLEQLEAEDVLRVGALLEVDPRRPALEDGTPRHMLAVWCWCGRFYTVTPEAMQRVAAELEAGNDDAQTCPNLECGKGDA